MGPELVLRHGCEPELVVGLCVHGVRAAWLCIGPVLVLRVGLVVDGDRMVSGLVVHGVRVGLWG